MTVNSKPQVFARVCSVWGWAQHLTTPAGSRPPLSLAARTDVARYVAARSSASVRAFTLLAAMYWGCAACARPQYVADQHAALQSPVTLGEGNTGKPALDEIPGAGGKPAGKPPVHPPTPARGTSPAACHDHASGPSSGAVSAGCTDAVGAPRGTVQPGNLPSGAPDPAQGSTDTTTSAPDPVAPDPVALALGTDSAQNPDGASAATPPDAPSTFDPRKTPDPEPASTAAYYELTLRYCNASVHLLGARRVTLKRPSTLPRLMGRFAAELWIGHELLERDRFDFPLTAADTVPAPGTERKEPQVLQLAPGTDVVWKVKVADRVRATQAWVIDRATGERWLLDWPPQAPPSKPRADAPCPSLGGK